MSSNGFSCPDHASPCPGCESTDCDRWHVRRLSCANMTNGDKNIDTMAELLGCSEALDPAARLLGNVRAGDIAVALRWAITELTKAYTSSPK